MIRLFSSRWVAPLIVISLCTAANAQSPNLYRVEVVVVAHNSPFAAGERFDLSDNLFGDATMGMLANTDDDMAVEPEPVQALGTFEPLGVQDFGLTETVARLGNASRFRVLGHFGWIQDAPDTAEALAKPVVAADTGGTVNGTILLSRSRFLRLDLDLTFADGDQTVELQQSRRRVQTNKPHYLDHPYFGVIVLVTRAPQPEQ
ncbi:MAG: CsiV family protein [Gammaproteobacteria bacterium]